MLCAESGTVLNLSLTVWQVDDFTYSGFSLPGGHSPPDYLNTVMSGESSHLV
jgi:hypothetical protein